MVIWDYFMPNHQTLITAIRTELLNTADARIKGKTQRFFKEDLNCYGCKAAQTNAIAKKFFPQLKTTCKQELFELCEELLKSNVFEEMIVSIKWCEKIHKQFELKDFDLFERWIDTYINNWATCDTFCNHSVGALVTAYPNLLPRLTAWTTSSNRWMRRASAVSLIVPAKAGHFLPEIFALAKALLVDTDDMVQKGYGWMLKEAAHTHEQKVFDFVIAHKKNMPRTALRYAIEKMPQKMRQQAMAKENYCSNN